MFSFQHAGLGRAAAFLGEADGELSGDLASWEGYGDFFGTVVRWHRVMWEGELTAPARGEAVEFLETMAAR